MKNFFFLILNSVGMTTLPINLKLRLTKSFPTIVYKIPLKSASGKSLKDYLHSLDKVSGAVDARIQILMERYFA